MATACKGSRLTDGEIEGSGNFGKLLDTLVEKFYNVRVDVSKDGKWNNLQWPPTIMPCKNQDATPKGGTSLAEDEIPDDEDDSCPV